MNSPVLGSSDIEVEKNFGNDPVLKAELKIFPNLISLDFDFRNLADNVYKFVLNFKWLKFFENYKIILLYFIKVGIPWIPGESIFSAIPGSENMRTVFSISIVLCCS